jgi:hypothetical protein
MRVRTQQRKIAMVRAFILGAGALALSAASPSAQVYVTPDYGYGYSYGYAAPVYGYAAQVYVAPPVYAAPPLYAAPAPLYGYSLYHMATMATRAAAVSGPLKGVGKRQGACVSGLDSLGPPPDQATHRKVWLRSHGLL